MNTDKIIADLDAYGADVDGALDRFLGDEELYAECLETFAADEGFAALGLALKEADTKRAFETAHMLKGVSANLGLTPMTEAVCAVVEPLRHNSSEDLTGGYEAILAQLETLRRLLRAGN